MAEKRLTKKQREQIENEWYNTMPERVKNWLLSLPPILKEKLDFSPESIVALQEYLWDKYDEYSITDIKNRDEAECAGYYYGEIHRRHTPIELRWESSDILGDDDISTMLLKNEHYLNCGTGIFRDLEYAMSEMGKVENHLVWYFNKKKEVHQRQIDNNEYASVFSIRLDDNYQYFLLHKTDTNSLLQIKALLEDYFSTRDNPPKLSYYRNNEDHLVIEMSDEYCFHFKYQQGNRVKTLIQEMAESKYSGEANKKEIALCRSTTEFWGDQDNNMDYMNEALWLLEYIAPKLPDLVTVYDLKNGDEILPK